MKLEARDLATTTWEKIENYLNERIALLRERNDNLKLDHVETTRIRAQIRECKELLALAEPAPAQPEMNEHQ